LQKDDDNGFEDGVVTVSVCIIVRPCCSKLDDDDDDGDDDDDDDDDDGILLGGTNIGDTLNPYATWLRLTAKHKRIHTPTTKEDILRYSMIICPIFVIEEKYTTTIVKNYYCALK